MPIPYWRLSAFYGFYFATLGALLPFWSLFLKAKGFNPTEIGELSALLAGTKIIAPYVWGWVADRSGKSLRCIRLAMGLAVVCFAGFLGATHYRSFALFTFMFSFFWNATLPQFEAATLYHIKRQPHRYAEIRLWGSIGFIAAVLGVGRFLDFFSIHYLPLIILSTLGLSWLVALMTPETKSHPPNAASVSIWQIALSSKVSAFLLVYLLLQIAHSPYYIFFTVYLKQLHYAASTIGFLWALGVLAEIGLFLLMRPLIQRLRLRVILLWSIVLSAGRWLLIAYYADHLAILVAAQLLHAASFGSLHVVAMQFLQQYFGSQHQGKGQALYASVAFGLGGVIGNYYSGFFWSALGAANLFLLAAGCCGLAFFIAAIWVGREQSKQPIPEDR